MTGKSPQRLFYLDWLRVFAIVFVLIYHSSRFFNLEDWQIKNSTTYYWVEVWNSFASSWMMPLIFLISGASLFYALEKGGFGRFLKDKVLRLAVPLVVAMFTHASWQIYLERLTHKQFSGSYFEFLPHYFEGIYFPGENGNFGLFGMHLWYLLILFIICLVTYPLLRWWKSRGQKVLKALASPLALPGGSYLLALAPIFMFIVLSPDTPGDLNVGGWNLYGYILFFLSGFILISHEPAQANIKHLRWTSLALASLLSAVYLYLNFTADWYHFGQPVYTLVRTLKSLTTWSWILTFMGFFMKYLNVNKPFLAYANEAVLPFYIEHQTVLLIVGYFIIPLGIPDLLKWLLILSISLGFIMAIYEFLIRRNKVMRFLFGMKMLEKTVGKQVVPARPEVSGQIFRL